MALVTLLDAKNKVIRDLDLDHESFIRDTELIEYFWDAVRDVSSQLLKMNPGDNYYLAKANISLVNGTGEYSMPSNIFGNKLVRIIYENGNRIYPVKKLKGKYVFETYHVARYSPSGIPEYKYLIQNQSTSAGFQIALVPKSQETLANALTVWYLREPEKATLDAHYIDIPEEYIQYVYSFVKVECLKKDVGNPMLEVELALKVEMRKDMIDGLSDQTADGDNEIENDMQHYNDSI